MASCLSGGTGRAYGFDLETIVKTSSSSLSLSLSSSTSSRHSNSSSPSSTLSESSNSPIAVSTRKPRTPRKRPNQTYNEAAALLSTACPSIFSITKKNNKQSKLPPNMHTYFFNEPPELLLPFPATERPIKVKPREIEFNGSWNYIPNSNSLESSEVYQDDFDAESILDEEIEEGIDSIMGNLNSIRESDDLSKEKSCFNVEFDFNYNTCYGYPMGLGFGGNLEFNFGFGLKNGVRALKNVNKGNWSSPAINMMNVSPPVAIKFKKSPIEKKKKVMELMNPIVGEENLSVEKGLRLSLKLNYDKVLEAWSDKGSPLLENMSTPESPGSDIHTRLAAIDLFSENELRDASVIRYKEKRRTWLFSKKITCQVRKVGTDRRPRCKGRFVKRSNSPTCEEI